MRCVARWRSIVTCLGLVTASGGLQPAWAEVDSLPAPQLVRIHPADADWTTGWLQRADRDSLHILSETDETRQVLAIGDIERLQLHHGTKLQTRRGAIIGGVIVGGAGLALGIAIAQDSWFQVSSSEVVSVTLMAAGAGAAAGALIGTLFRTDRWVDVPPPWNDLATSHRQAEGDRAVVSGQVVSGQSVSGQSGMARSLTRDASARWAVGAEASLVLPRRIDTAWGFGVFARQRLPGSEFVIEPRLDYWIAKDEDGGGSDGYVEIRDIAVRIRASYFLPLSTPRIVFVGAGLGLHRTYAEIDRDWDGYQSVQNRSRLGVDLGLGLRTFLPARVRFHLEGWSTFAGDAASNLALSAGLSYAFGAP